MACSYFPRPVDRAVRDALERRERGVLVGVRGSGVSTTVKRMASIAGVKVGVSDCREYGVAEVEMGRLAEVAKCNWFVASTGTLEEVLRAVSQLDAWVMPPMSTGELEDFLSTFGQRAEPRVLEALLYRTGGFPGAVCKALEELNYPGKITQAHVEKLPAGPTWFIEFVDKYGRPFLKGSVLAALSIEDAKALGVERGLWFEERGGRLYLRLPWLQFFAVHYDPAYAREVLKEAVKVVKEGASLLQYYALLWRLGVEEYVEESAKYVDLLYELPPPHAAELAKYFLEVESRVGEEAAAKALHALSVALQSLDARPEDVIKLAQKAASYAPRRQAYDALYHLGIWLMSRGLFREADAVVGTAEDLLFRAKNDEEWVRAKRVLHLLLSYRESLLGNWREVRRLLEDEMATLPHLDDYGDLVKRGLAWAYIMLGQFHDAKALLKGDRGFHRWAYAFLRARDLGRVRQGALRSGQRLIAALAGLAMGLDVRKELEQADIRPELRELLEVVANPDYKRLAAVSARISPTDKLVLYLYAVEAYVMWKLGMAKRGEVESFLERVREAAEQAGIPGASRYVKLSRRALARLAVFFL